MPLIAVSPLRRVLYRFVGWFFLVNTLLMLLLGANYLHSLPQFHALTQANTASITMGWAFLITSFVAQLAILFFSFCLIVLILVTLFPKRWLAFILSVFLTSILMFSLIADSIVFGLYHMHYVLVGLTIITSGALSQVIPLSLHELLMVMGMFLVLFLIESFIAWLVWRRISRHQSGRMGYVFVGMIGLSFIAAYSLNFFALTPHTPLSTASSRSILAAGRLVPYFSEIYEAVIPGDNSVRHLVTESGSVYLQTGSSNRLLKYPLSALTFNTPKQKLNILVIGIDTWRYDAMTPKISPNIYRFAQKTLQFQNQWSGGNCTEPGLFALFYGIPANYWHAAIDQQKGPLLIKELVRNDYQLGIFASAPLNWPAFDKTIFLDDKNLLERTVGATTIDRDQQITQEFIQFLKKRNPQQPFFSFLFYDAVHNYCESTTPKEHPFKPWVKSCDRFSLTRDSDPTMYMNRYHNAVYFVDGQVQKVLTALEQNHLLDNTIVILTADHGEEINDNHSGYWEHASAYTPYQLHVPMLVYWPGKTPQVYKHFTTHYDLAPTLMTDVLGCQTPLAQYTIGQSLFTPGQRPFLIAGSYADYAVVTQQQATRIYPGGDYVIDDQWGQPLHKAALEKTSLEQAFEYLNRYFHQTP